MENLLPCCRSLVSLPGRVFSSRLQRLAWPQLKRKLAAVLIAAVSLSHAPAAELIAIPPALANQLTADLWVEKTGPQWVTRGAGITYNVKVKNHGPHVAETVVIADEIPAGLTFDSVISSNECLLNAGGDAVLCNNFNLQPGESRVFVVAFDIEASVACGTNIRNEAVVSSASTDPDVSDNKSVLVTELRCAECSDGVDNDNDGTLDYPGDFSCDSINDNDEGNPKAQCQDGIDNDGDGQVDHPNDSGCDSPQDNEERLTIGLCTEDDIDRVSIQDAYALLKVKNQVYFHRTVHILDQNEWENVSRNQPWDGKSIRDIDLTQLPVATNTPTTPKAVVIGGDNHVYLNDNLINVNTQWVNIDNNAPWGNTQITNGSISPTGGPGSNDLIVVISAGDRVYMRGVGANTTWVDVTGNQPWGPTEIQDVDGHYNGDYLLAVNVHGRQYVAGARGTATSWGLQHHQLDGGERIDVEFRPQINKIGDKVFYSKAPWAGGGAYVWSDISDNKPWETNLVKDVSVFFWSVTEPWNTPALGMTVAATRPFLHLNPHDVNRSEWLDVSDNAPWNKPGGVCVKVACNDGIDNDSDGLKDFPNDPGCSSEHDISERNPNGPQCDNGQDDDLDGKRDFPLDLDCTGPTDNDEGSPECRDGRDNDGDGLIDLNDPGCTGPDDGDEFNQPIPQCSDGQDNDGDGTVDFPADFSCGSAHDNDEQNPKAQCQDHIDNDGDGKIDLNDPGCASPQDNDEFNQAAAQCNDGVDNDGDGKIDFPNDPGCSNAQDNDEFNQVAPQCKDGVDNDGDGLIDFRGGSTTVIEHNGATNPETEGWTRVVGPGSPDGPVVNDQGSGIDAWFVDDNWGQGGAFLNTFFVKNLSNAQIAQAQTNGWKLTTRLRVVDIPDPIAGNGPYSVTVNPNIGGQDFVMHFGTEPDGDPIVRVSTSPGGGTGESYTLQGSNGGYHLYELIFDPQRGAADLYVDGVKRLTDLTGYQWNANNAIGWGSGSNPDVGRGHYNHVKFEIFGSQGDPGCESPEDDDERDAPVCSQNDLRVLMYAFAVDGREQTIVNEIRSLGYTIDFHSRNSQPTITPALLSQYHTVWFTNGNGGGPVLTQAELDAIRNFYLGGGNIIGQTDESHPGDWTARVNQIVNNVGINHSGHTRYDGHGVCIGLTNKEPIVSNVDSIGRATRASISFTGNVNWGTSTPKPAALHLDNSVAFGFVERENGHGFVFTDPDFTGFANVQCDRLDLYRSLFSHAPCPPINPQPQCSDGVDNDGDGLVDLNDPGCDNQQDDSEKNPNGPQCDNGRDDDGDGRVDFPNDPDCTGPTDSDESNQQCLPKGTTVMQARLPDGRGGTTCSRSAANGKIYCFGGTDRSGLDPAFYTQQIVEYTPATDSLVIKGSSLPTRAIQRSCAENSATGKIYCFGGYPVNSTNSVVEYDPVTDTVRNKSTLPFGERNALTCIEDSSTHLIYCLGGTHHGGGGGTTNQIFAYNPVTDTFTAKNAVLPNPSYFRSCVEDKQTQSFICFGGQATNGQTSWNLDEIIRYYPATDTLSVQTGNLPQGALVHNGCTMDDASRTAYCFGGYVGAQHNHKNPTDVIFTYNPANGSITVLPDKLPSARGIGDSQCVIDPATSCSYCFGGTTTGGVYFDDIIRYCPNQCPGQAQCSDGVDNDGDGLVDLNDPGCDNQQDDSEKNSNGPQCDNGIDDDGDGKTDFPADPGCDRAFDPDEGDPLPAQCLDRITVQDSRAIVKGGSHVYYHQTAHEPNNGDWVNANDNRPWGQALLGDIDMTERPKGVSGQRAYSAIVSQGSHVYLHSNLEDMNSNDWVSISANKPWGNATIDNVSIAGLIGKHIPFHALVSVDDRAYFYSTEPNPLGVSTWVDITDNQPWNGADILDLDVTSEARIILAAGGRHYSHSNLFNLAAGNWVLSGPANGLPGAQFPDGSADRIDWDWRPVTASRGNDVFYTRYNTWTVFTDVSDNRPWGQNTIDDVGLYFWLQTDPWGTPAIVTLLSDDEPYMHIRPEDINQGDWFSIADNAPWNLPGQACGGPATQCSDGVDNDGDGLVDLNDPGCDSPHDTSEKNPNGSQCDNGRDDDGDGKVDFPGDPDCDSPSDDREERILNADLWVEKTGPEWVTRSAGITYNIKVKNHGPDVAETVVVADEIPAGLTFDDLTSSELCVLNAGEDTVLCNNFDLQPGESRVFVVAFDIGTGVACGTDIRNEAVVSSASTDPNATDNKSILVTELRCSECSDGIDNDSDGTIDFPGDFSCDSANDNDETNPKAQCQDHLDNDGDGQTDFPNDTGCDSPQDNEERLEIGLCNEDDIDRVSIQDAYALLKVKNQVYFHRTVHILDQNEWENVSRNQPWDGHVIRDIDLTQLPVATNTPTTPKAIVVGGDNSVYFNDDLINANSQWQNMDGNAPWGDAKVTNASISPNGGRGSTNIILVVSAADRVYARAITDANWTDSSGNKPWGDADIQDVDGHFNGDYLLAVNVHGRQYIAGARGAATSWGLQHKQLDGGERIDIEYRPQIGKIGDNVFYSSVPWSGNRPWGNISDNKPWETNLVKDVSVFFWSVTEPWGTPALGMVVAATRPYLHLNPQSVNHSEWLDVSDNAPWNKPGGVCAKVECNDHVDNDGDGLRDFPNDPGCESSLDTSERNPNGPQCDNGLDDDLDGQKDFPADPDCDGPTDNDESSPQCKDGRDNDGDGLIDLNDPGCSAPHDDDEKNPNGPECDNNRDDDGDGRVDFPADPHCDSAHDDTEGSQCQDGIDNDGDGAIDFPTDFSCSSAEDDDETHPKAQCQDQVDNDGDGLVDLNDPGCTRPQDNAERNSNGPACDNGLDDDNDGKTDFPADPECQSPFDNSEREPRCSDGQDNDRDGVIDFPNDFSCSSANDDDETHPKSQCQDGVDNDSDGFTDFPVDPGCSSSQDNSERGAGPACDNGQDDDGDGKVDFPADPQCTGPMDDTETAQCSDQVDNDGDGATDWPADFSCNSVHDDDETHPKSQCQDGVDNDGDGTVDFPHDPGCESLQDNSERNPNGPQCDNGQDDDNDGKTDFPADPDCDSPTDDSEKTPQCSDRFDNDGDGAADFPFDFSCQSADDDDEFNPKAQCQDGEDNDGDGATDWPADFACDFPNDDDEGDAIAQCQDGQDNDGDSLTDFPADPGCLSSQDDTEFDADKDTADLSIIKEQIGGTDVLRGDTVKYRLTVRNNGPVPATNVVAEDPVPAGLTFRADLTDNDCVAQDNDILCNNLNLAVGATKVYEIGFEVAQNAACDSAVQNTATVTALQNDPNLTNNSSTTSTTVRCKQCEDGQDNDGDGVVDLDDPGCSEPADDDESDGTTQCQDGEDNDGDGAVDFPADPGCENPQDNNEKNPNGLQCDNGQDDDGDGLSDFPADPGCSSPSDDVEADESDLSITKIGPANVERGGTVVYQLTVTNNGPLMATNIVAQDPIPAGLTFNANQSSNDCVIESGDVLCNNTDLDPGTQKQYVVAFDVPDTADVCETTIVNEVTVTAFQNDPDLSNNTANASTTVTCAQCQDGEDNDGDGQTDFPADAGCASPQDDDEKNPNGPQCDNGIDDDGDGQIDFPADPDCDDPTDDMERTPECSDGLDNDGDGVTDFPHDFSCATPDDDDETNPKAQCQDGTDNDNDGATDWPNDFSCSSLNDDDEGDPLAQCQDGNDNDGDGLTDLTDPGCSSPQDNDESDGTTQCQDGEDNDGDGVTDLDDPGCDSPQDDDESDGTTQCQDGTDNDGDGATDHPADFSCSSPQDNDEALPQAQCQDGEDNDGDGVTDLTDPGCSSPQDNDESDGTTQCQDGEDNDGDGVTDLTDPGCSDPTDDDESDATTQCQDETDNDGDGATDHPADFSCSSPQDNDEALPQAQCQDGEDNDGDGVTDLADPGCSSPQDNNESDGTTQCQDGEDNDGDGVTDLTDPGCSDPTDDDESDGTTQCQDGEDNDGDGQTDFPADPGCASPQDDDEKNPNGPECDNGQDDDGDGLSDFPADLGCTDPADGDETDEANLNITKSGPATVLRGGTVVYELWVKNEGPLMATNVVAADPIPAGLTFNAAASSSDCVQEGSDILCNNTDLEPGEEMHYTVAFDVLDALGMCNTTLFNKVTVTAFQSDPDVSDNTAHATTKITCAECQDGIDNDGDGATDHPADFSCNSPQDDDEAIPDSQCQDGVDNDGDGVTDLDDPGCADPQDNDESDGTTQCQDGVDNDGDGLTDLADPGCSEPQDNDESDGTTQCQDGEDNDGDGETDFPADPGCESPQDDDEKNPNGPQCDNGQDDDGDGQTDFPADPGCASPSDDTESDDADLTITKSGPATVGRGQTVVYELWVKNNGPLTATNVVTADPIPAGLTFNAATSSADCLEEAGDILCDNIDLAPGQEVHYEVAFDVPDTLAVCDTTISNEATATAFQNDPDLSNNTDSVETTVVCAQCQDGVDNDGDGATDHPDDFSCQSPQDDDEAIPSSQCQDGQDNDGDGVTDLDDPGCADPQDNDESDGTTQCQDGTDNDGDGATDHPADFSCSSPQDNDETSPASQCQDGEDNDGDGVTDLDDPGCADPQDNDESDGTTQCQDGEDNDGDGVTDMNDPGCSSPQDDDESDGTTQCQDGEDNDGDGLTDLADPGCSNPQDNDESDGTTQCQDGEDNDGDGQTDFAADPGCESPQDDDEKNPNGPQCDNGQDDDGDGQTDFPADPGCGSPSDDSETDDANLSLTKSAPATVGRGKTVVYELWVKNNGPLTATNVVTADPIPAGLTFNAGASSSDCIEEAGDILCNNIDLAPGEEVHYEVAFDVPDTLAVCDTTISNEATATAFQNDPDLSDNTSRTQTTVTCNQCQDGVDNDGDGATDHPADFSCNSPEDNSEAIPSSQCQDGEDNDGDGITDLDDPGCADPQDNDESDGTTQCQDGEDNDGDGLTDLADPGCSDPQDDDESDGTSQCQDGEDNDGDGATDHPADFSCSSPQDNDEAIPASQCQDEVDNDGDGVTDLDDPGCADPQDNDESDGTTQCQDGEDNDGDGVTDLDDPGCDSPQDNDESDGTTQCQDGEDNDGDGVTDFAADPGCESPQDDDEKNPNGPQCDNGQDDDGDGQTDFPADPGCLNPSDNTESDDADLTITKSGPATIGRGQTVVYELFVKNPGPLTATNVTVEDPIPAGLTFNASQSSQGCVQQAGDILCDNTNLTPGETATFTVAFDVPDTLAVCDTTIVNEATVSALQNDPDLSDNASSMQTIVTCNQCQDGVDNDGDGATDHPADFSCQSPEDNNEAIPSSQCQDGEDNDGDGVTDLDDPGCSDAQDNDESDGTTQCQDGEDNDGDGLTDLADPGCSDPQDDDESDGTSQCQDGEDNDGDGATDHPADFSCSSPQDNDEAIPASQCQDGVDNDGDGVTDLDDPGCADQQDNDESDATTQCQDGEDNDGDGLTDLNDPGCSDAQDNDESDGTSQCQDGVDNDGDGTTDFADDPGCESPQDDDEKNPNGPQCDNGIDDDGDGKTDFPTDEGCDDPTDDTESDEANLSLTKTGPATVGRGQTVSYELLVKNGGPLMATNVTVEDPIPAGLTFNAAASSSECVQEGDDILCDNTNLAPGGDMVFTVAFDVPDTLAVCDSTIVNAATVTALQKDPDLSDNAASAETTVTCAQCQDGIDNDGDGAVDHPADFSCQSPQDDDEAIPSSQCQDGVDNDSDGVVDLDDPGCADLQDNNESDGTTQCQDGEDNDGDGVTDLDDPGCSDPQDDDESDGTTECQDGEDNDGDGVTDLDDPGCSSPQDDDESDGTTQCQDGEDNDGDGVTDLDDPGCSDPQDDDESDGTTQCQDGEDNDGDGVTDLDDPGCSSPQDDDESDGTTQCQDGEDNDGDGVTDLDDPGCSDPQDDDESDGTTECQDGEDNDGDGVTDLDDPGCSSPQDDDESDGTTQCQDGIDNDGDDLIDLDDLGCESPQDDDETGGTPKCNGQIATIYVALDGTIVGGDKHGKTYKGKLKGTSGNDVIVGTTGEDDIDGESGDDTICGLGGDDELEGGSGNDYIDGGHGNDEIDADAGDDIVFGGPGDDEIDAASGNDIVCAEAGNDFIEGESGNDQLDGGTGDDEVKGDSGHDLIDGGEGNDTVHGGVGNDTCDSGDTIKKCETVLNVTIAACSDQGSQSAGTDPLDINDVNLSHEAPATDQPDATGIKEAGKSIAAKHSPESSESENWDSEETESEADVQEHQDEGENENWPNESAAVAEVAEAEETEPSADEHEHHEEGEHENWPDEESETEEEVAAELSAEEEVEEAIEEVSEDITGQSQAIEAADEETDAEAKEAADAGEPVQEAAEQEEAEELVEEEAAEEEVTAAEETVEPTEDEVDAEDEPVADEAESATSEESAEPAEEVAEEAEEAEEETEEAVEAVEAESATEEVVEETEAVEEEEETAEEEGTEEQVAEEPAADAEPEPEVTIQETESQSPAQEEESQEEATELIEEELVTYTYECTDGLLALDTSTKSKPVLAKVNTEHGVSVKLATIERPLASLVLDFEGTLYALEALSPSDSQLIVLEQDGEVEVAGSTGLPAENIKLAFGPEETLYALDQVSGTVYEMDADTGEVTAIAQLPSLEIRNGDYVINADSQLLYVSEAGEIYQVDLTELGSEPVLLGSLPQDGQTYVGVAVYDDVVYVLEETYDEFYAVTAEDGTLDYELVSRDSGPFGPGDATSCYPEEEEDEEDEEAPTAASSASSAPAAPAARGTSAPQPAASTSSAANSSSSAPAEDTEDQAEAESSDEGTNSSDSSDSSESSEEDLSATWELFQTTKNDVFLACAKGQVVLDGSGKPYNCSRYHDNGVWRLPEDQRQVLTTEQIQGLSTEN